MKNIREAVRAELTPFLEQEGYELYHISFDKEGKEHFLRVFFEAKRANGEIAGRPIGTDDCEKVSNFLSERLDSLDIINSNYYLEVSSPGIDRQLYEPEDFKRFVGCEIDISLYKPINGQKQFAAKLLDSSSRGVHVLAMFDKDIKEFDFDYEDMAKVKLVPVF